ncbi:MAG: SLC45 family MFS transporter [Chitinophagales bacterium]|jgi:maltose/moltooligosaccharide transporter|nr:SLC45 family MFS transporter [Bacteroidota bacterium]MBL0278834.1 SLC45 family MFS transporter [Bacteroidota bacterium]MBP8248768.1 SLC45 family MFS transporter [Chitinophagales bacterium]MBP9880015.1 SLC45 family MFS transporter [Chitinophagales bacterium]
MEKPRMSFWQIWNMSFGFLGIQFGFALQNGNASSILQNFGADIHHLSWYWLVAPITGMIVQPIIGHYSDNTWTKLGRRKPYFLLGTILCCLALVLLPNSAFFLAGKSALLIGAGFLMIMDASINIAMEPFRALVADNLPDKQRTLGFSIQTVLIGVGAVVGSWLPWVLANWANVSASAPDGQVANNVIYSFYIGAIVFFGAIMVTIIFAKEYPPKEYEQYHGKPQKSNKGIWEIFSDFSKMPKTMKQLGLVQFFSWFALFGMWVFTTPAIAHHIYNLPVDDTSSDEFRKAGNWVGIIFGVYNLVSAIYAIFLPAIARKIGRKLTHAISLTCGGAGLISMFFASSPEMLIFSMIGVGIAWASILAMPYAILAGSIPAGKMGVYMGIFNFFITIPQIINGIVGGPIVHAIYNDNAIYAIVMSGVFMICAAVSVIYVHDDGDITAIKTKPIA